MQRAFGGAADVVQYADVLDVCDRRLRLKDAEAAATTESNVY